MTYKRADGVQLSFTLYLPPDYKEGTRLPTMVWAYPREFDDADTAGQIERFDKRASRDHRNPQLFHVLDGYAVLENAAMPVVGDPEVVNNTYVEADVKDAKAAIDKAAEMGVTDPDRVGRRRPQLRRVHDREPAGALRDLFKAGVAEKRRLQSNADAVRLPERAADDVAGAGSVPEDVAVHVRRQDQGADAVDPRRGRRQHGTFPIQSDRMYQAVRGNGGTARLVFLPHEAHGYRGEGNGRTRSVRDDHLVRTFREGRAGLAKIIDVHCKRVRHPSSPVALPRVRSAIFTVRS